MATSILAQDVQSNSGTVGSGLNNSLQIPIKMYPGRGAASLPVTLYYSSNLWRIKYTGSYKNPESPAQVETMTEAKYAEYSAAGWTSSLGVPTLEWLESSDAYNNKGELVCSDCIPSSTSWLVARLNVRMPDGSTHELRRTDTPYTGGVNASGNYYAVDGTRLRYETSTSTLYLPDGARYILGESTVQFIDRNGNTLNYARNTDKWTDTLGREIYAPPLTRYAGDYTYSPPGSPLPYTFRWTYLSDTLAPDPITGVTPQLGYAGGHYKNGTPSFDNMPLALSSPHLFESTENQVSGFYNYVLAPQAVFNPVVLSEIVLPNGLSYKFKYNEYGELAKVTYPTGAFEQYKYGQIINVNSLMAPYNQSNRGVTSKWVSADGTGNDRERWQYGVTYDSATNTYIQWTTEPNNLYTERYLFKAPPSQTSPKFGFEDPRNGMVKDERVYEYQNGPMLRRKLTDWVYSSQNVSTTFNGVTTTAAAMRNPRATKEVSLILDTGDNYALAKTLTYEYDATYQFTTGLDLTIATESSFDNIPQTTALSGTISTISPNSGSVVSKAVTTYLADSNYRNRNILGLVTSVVLKNGNDQPVGKTVTAYDESPYANSLSSYSNLGNTWTDPGTNAPRGNVTTVRRYINASSDVLLSNQCPTGVCLDTHAYFDQVGNIWKAKDARGIEIETIYNEDYKYAYATEVKTTAPDSSGVHGSNQRFTSSSVYDPDTGLVLLTTDVNGQTTTYSYKDDSNITDPLNRLRKVTRPNGNWTKYSFNDDVDDLYAMTEIQFEAIRTTKSYQFFDAMGRASRSFALESGTTYLASEVQYDQFGRVWRTSNPYRVQDLGGTINSSDMRWTTSTYDVLGRVKIVMLPDNTSVQSDYQGVYTTVMDQASKKRRQKMDSLGRIVRVDEPNALGDLGGRETPAQATYYDYSTQGNLVHIQQGTGTDTQHRYFKYDALGRLTYERQVEQAAIFTTSDAQTPANPTSNTAWTRKINYDESGYTGLVSSMRDARNILTQYAYDNLDRITQVTYSDGTPTVKSYYDQVRFTATGETRTIYNLGRLAEVTTEGSGTTPATSQVYNYDLMGRIANNRQTVGSNPYTMSYNYNLGGALVSQKYPSGRVVTNSFDDAARLSSVTSGGTNYISQHDYSSPQGLLKSVTMGNGTVQAFDYNDRLQLKTLSLTKNSSILQKYDYKYGQVNPATGAVDETKNNGQISRIEGFIGTQKQWQQRYSYDSLGRLSQASEYQESNNQLSLTYKNTFSYDLFGNLYQKNSENPSANQPLPFTEVTDTDIDRLTNRFKESVTNIKYDDAGNLTEDPKFRGRKYSYDANGRQKSTSLIDNTGMATSVYDGAGQRVATIMNGTTSIMVYDADGKLIAEYGQAAGTGGTQYVFSDHQGSTRVVTEADGDVLSRHDYQPFGEEIYSGIGQRTTTQGYDQSDSARQKYAGMEKDDASGMAHTLWRKYDGTSGRWTSPDPYGGSMTVSDPQSFNRYSYVNNDPVNQSDPLGLMADADQGIGGFEGWGGTPSFNDPHFGGPNAMIEGRFRTRTTTYQYNFIIQQIDNNQVSEEVEIVMTETLKETIDIHTGESVAFQSSKASASAFNTGSAIKEVTGSRLKDIENAAATIVEVSREQGVEPAFGLGIASEETFLGGGTYMEASIRNNPAMVHRVNPMQLHPESGIQPSATDLQANIRGAINLFKRFGLGKEPLETTLGDYGGRNKKTGEPNYKVALQRQLEYINYIRRNITKLSVSLSIP